MSMRSKVILAIATILGMGSVNAFEVKVTNHTLKDLYVMCTSGQCAYLYGLNDAHIPPTTVYRNQNVGYDFKASFVVSNQLGSCNYSIAQQGGKKGTLKVVRVGDCKGNFTGNVSDEASHDDSFVNIVLINV